MLKKILLFGLRNRIKGFGYISRKIYRKGIISSNKYGIRFLLDPYQMIDHEILSKGYYDQSVLDALLLQLKDGDVFWDVGANIGLHSLTVKKLRNVVCHSFEPYYVNFKKLMTNQELNPGYKLNKYNFGLSDKISVVQIHSTAGNLGLTGFKAMKYSSPTETNVIAVTGDSLVLEGLEIPNVIKLDTEDHELFVLMGCETILKSQRLRAIVYEAGANQDKIKELLEKNGFVVSKLDQHLNFLAVR